MEIKVGIWGSLGSNDYVRVCTKSTEAEAFYCARLAADLINIY